MPSRRKHVAYDWDGSRVRALRAHLGMTQQQLSEELGIRQQTVSEWETGAYSPRGASARLLSMVAERSGFAYATRTEPSEVSPDGRDSHGR